MFKKIMFTGLTTLFAMSAFASEDILGEEVPLVWQSIITLSGGPVWASPGLNQYLYTDPIFPYDNYIPNSTHDVLGSGEIFFGLQRIFYPGLTGQLGIGLAGAADADLSGTVNVLGVPDLYTYQYKVEHLRAELKGKLIGNSFRVVQPYVSGSIGAAFNNSHDYSSTSVSPILFPSPWYTTNTTTAFTYTLGLGIQAMINPNWQVGVGYEFADWGKSALGVETVNYTQGLTLTHLYTNELLFSLSYLF